MVKLRKFKRDLPLWTKTQLQERKRRRMMDRRMRFGMPTPPGTPPRRYTGAGEPVFKPMRRWGFPGLPSFDWLWGFISLLPWLGMRRRRREAELALRKDTQLISYQTQNQRSQSIKAKSKRRK